MSLEIHITVPDSPDVVKAIGEITHLATMYGSDVRMRRVNRNPGAIGDLTQGRTPTGEAPAIPDPPTLEEVLDNGDGRQPAANSKRRR